MDEKLPQDAHDHQGTDDPQGTDDARTPQDVAAEDAALARVRAADPAAAAVLTPTDLAALRAAVDRRRTAGTTDELGARRLRRLTSWPARAAAVAAVALVAGAGGGYAVGAAGGSDASTVADSAEAAGADTTAEGPISLSAPEAANEADLGAADGAATEGAAGGAGRGGADMAMGGWYGRTVFSASGLSDAEGTGRAWAFDAGGVSAEAAGAAAQALGVSGEPRLEYGDWVVGPNDGSGATVTLSADGVGSLYYWNPEMDPWSCGVVTDAGADAAEPCEERDLGDAPQGAAATDAVRESMVALGADPAGYEIVVEDTGEAAYAYVVAYQVVDGQRTGLTWNASLTGAGMSSLFGFTADLVDLGEYDVISPTAAVERLNDPRFGATFVGPVLARAEAETLPAPEAEEPDGVPPAPLTPGSTFSWPVQHVTITQARLGVAVVTGADGAQALAPAYELTADDGAVWSVVAVTDAALEFDAD